MILINPVHRSKLRVEIRNLKNKTSTNQRTMDVRQYVYIYIYIYIEREREIDR